MKMTHTHYFSVRSLSIVFSLLLISLLAASPPHWRAQGQGGNQVTTVSAASFLPAVAPDSIAAAFGVRLAVRTEAATSQPLPTNLAGTTVRVNGQIAPLFFVSPNQVNYLIPPGTLAGTAGVVVTSGDGTVSTGTAQVAAVAPALFTANGSGQGLPAAVALRIRPDGTQITEPIGRLDAAQNTLVPLQIDPGPDGERVFLILFGSGFRARRNLSDVSVKIGGVDAEVHFAGLQSGFAGLDQANVLLPRALAGRGRVNLALGVNGFLTSNIVELEIAARQGPAPPQVAGLSDTTVLAGQSLTITGQGFAANAQDNLVRIGGVEARVTAASTIQLTVRVPFGAGSGPVTVRTQFGEVSSAVALNLRTSISGVVEDTRRQPLAGVVVRLRDTNISATTNADGSFLLPDVAPKLSNDIEVDGSRVPGDLPFPKVVIKARSLPNRDNPIPGPIALQQINGPAIAVGGPGLTTEGAGLKKTLTAAVAPQSPQQTGRAGNVVFEVQPGTTAVFPDGSRRGVLNLAIVENSRTPVSLPSNIFSTVIAQITAIGVMLSPGGKLSFPNPENLPAGARATLYRFDQKPNSPTLGSFIPSGDATVSGDGQRIETVPGAIAETTLYFVAAPRPATTVVGRVVDSDGATPARQARVRCRGQEAFTDGNGGFVIRDVLANQGDQISVEASFTRPDQRVDRLQRDRINAVVNGITQILDPLVLPADGSNRPPVVLIPLSLTIAEGETRNLSFVVGDPDPGQRVEDVRISGQRFVSLARVSNDLYALKLSPQINDAGVYMLNLTATDNAGASLTEEIKLVVSRPPAASSQTLTLDEDTAKSLTLTGNDPGGLQLSFIIVSLPANGDLSGAPPNLTYTPRRDFNGTDSFTFKVSNGVSDSQPAPVSLFVRPVNDAPTLTTPGPQMKDEGSNINFLVTAADVDAGDLLTFTATRLPGSATFIQLNNTSAQFDWTPSFTEAGSYTVSFRVCDNSVPAQCISRPVQFTINDVNRPPRIAPIGEQNVSSGENSSFTISASDPDQGQSLTFSAMGLPAGATFDPASKRFSWAPGFLQLGSYTVTFKVTDDGASALSAMADVLINVKGRWGQAGPLEGGVINTLLVNGATLLAGTNGGGVFRSTDNGQNWMPTNLTDRNVQSLAASGTSLFAAGYGAGVFRSTNQGERWDPVNSFPTLLVNTLSVSGSSIFAGTEYQGVFRSTDQGQTWVAVSRGLPRVANGDVTPIVGFAGGGANLFVITKHGVFRSTDDGDNWTPAGPIPGNPNVYTLVFSGSSLFAGTGGGGVFRSSDNGQTWIPVNSGLESRVAHALVVSGANLFAATDNGVHVSSNLGSSWTPVNAGLPPVAVSFAVSGANLFAGTRGAGVFRTTDSGQSWTPADRGLTAMIVNTLAVIGPSILAGVKEGGVYRSDDQGQSWTPVNVGLPHPFTDAAAFVISDSTIYLGTNGNGVFRSTNQGQIWTPVNEGLTNPDVFALVISGGDLFAGTDTAVFRLTDQGQNWVKAGNGIIVNNEADPGIYALATQRGAIFAGTYGGGVFRSMDQGNNWTPVNAGLSDRSVISFASRGNDLFVSTYGRVFRSPDLGQRWEQFDEELGVEVHALLPAGDILFAGSIRGVFYLRGDERKWKPVSDGLTTTSVRSFAVSGGRVFAGTVGGGVFLGK